MNKSGRSGRYAAVVQRDATPSSSGSDDINDLLAHGALVALLDVD